MQNYTAFNPNVKVKGIAILSVIAGLGEGLIPILEKHNLYPVSVEQWYSQQDWLNAIATIESRNFMDLVAVGMKVPDNAVWPEHIDNVHDALASINVAYQMNHTGGEIGGYYYKQTGEREGTMVCENPYPSDFDYGLIYRTVQKFLKQNLSSMKVRRDDTQRNRLSGGKSCTYYISW